MTFRVAKPVHRVSLATPCCGCTETLCLCHDDRTQSRKHPEAYVDKLNTDRGYRHALHATHAAPASSPRYMSRGIVLRIATPAPHTIEDLPLKYYSALCTYMTQWYQPIFWPNMAVTRKTQIVHQGGLSNARVRSSKRIGVSECLPPMPAMTELQGPGTDTIHQRGFGK